MRIIEQQSAKTKSGLRTLPLIGSFREYFMRVDYLTNAFPKFPESHSCASLQPANGVTLKHILGHSNFTARANIYAHLDYSSKLTSADAMLNGLGFAAN